MSQKKERNAFKEMEEKISNATYFMSDEEEEEDSNIIGEVLNFDRDGKWHAKIEEGDEAMKITMDSGAVDTVGPPEAAVGVDV